MIAGRKTGAVVRAFFAVALPGEAREACHALARELGSAPNGQAVRWVRPEGYHLTLRFLGNVGLERLPELTGRVAERLRSFSPFRVRLTTASVFPSLRSPRVVVVAAEPKAPLAALAAEVEAGVVAAGFESERRAFRAHLTLGRVRNRRFPSLDSAAVGGAPEIPVEEVVLFRSDLEPSGAVYTTLQRIALAGRCGEANPFSP